MMQEIALYDPDRPSPWTDLLQRGQYIVFHSDVATQVERTADGRYLQSEGESRCLVFDSLPEAEAYCEAKVQEIPRLRCDIYDHTGESRPPMLTYVNKVHVKSHTKYAAWGWVLIAGSLLFFWWEWARTPLGLGLILGVNMLFAACDFCIGGAEGRRRGARRVSSEEALMSIGVIVLAVCPFGVLIKVA